MELQPYEIEHNARLRTFGPECAVLLKSNGAFPLDAPGPIALFGSGARRTVKGGTGSGEVNSRFFVTVEEGLENAGFTVTSKYWMETYEQLRQAARADFLRQLRAESRKKGTLAALEFMGAVMPEPEYTIPLYGEGETAVYVLARISGEGTDRKAVPGDVLLTETEIRDILSLQKKYKKFLLVLNVGGVVDLSPVLAVENILLLSQLGTETGTVLADLLLGRAYPSGKLSTTWAAWGDYPNVGDFGGRNETRYREGVYVGYRYFDSVGKKPLFPFGYGLGYTDFAWKAGALRAKGETVTLKATVTNTGSRPGKEVLQLYVSQPGQAVDQPYQTLAAFAKTEELQPGEKEELSLCFSLRDLAYYDEENSAWTLEKGRYLLRLGCSSADTRLVGALRLGKAAVTVQCRPCGGKPDFRDWKPEKREPEKISPLLRTLRVCAKKIEKRKIRYRRKEEPSPETEELSNEELMLLGVGAVSEKKGLRSVIGDSGQTVAGAAGETCRSLARRGIPSLVMADGPAGLRLSREFCRNETGVHPIGPALPESITELLPEPLAWALGKLHIRPPEGERGFQYASAIPIGTAIAQSWNTALAEGCGDLVGDEMERFGVHLWLAPALNLHRDIRCGRNFEYFSEDPLVSGSMAAALARGVQRHPGCGVTIKHFAANNQETNRYHSNSQVSERALRELYLRGFGICVREGQPCAVMTSYNLLNGVHTAQRRDLIQDILRSEFGFDGIVMTDWIMPVMQKGKHKHPSPQAGLIAAAGGDLTMPGSKGDLKAMSKALGRKKLTRTQLRINAGRILATARRLTEARREKKA